MRKNGKEGQEEGGSRRGERMVIGTRQADKYGRKVNTRELGQKRIGEGRGKECG